MILIWAGRARGRIGEILFEPDARKCFHGVLFPVRLPVCRAKPFRL